MMTDSPASSIWHWRDKRLTVTPTQPSSELLDDWAFPKSPIHSRNRALPVSEENIIIPVQNLPFKYPYDSSFAQNSVCLSF